MNELISTHDYTIFDRFTNKLICTLSTNGGFAWLRDREGDIPDTVIGFVSTHDVETRRAIADMVGTDKELMRIVSC